MTSERIEGKERWDDKRREAPSCPYFDTLNAPHAFCFGHFLFVCVVSSVLFMSSVFFLLHFFFVFFFSALKALPESPISRLCDHAVSS